MTAAILLRGVGTATFGARFDRFTVADAYHAYDVIVCLVADVEVAAVVDGGEARVGRELKGF